MAVTGIFYNEEVLDAAGVDPEDIQSWDDFSDACAAITETGATCLGASGKDNYTAGNIADYMLPSVYADDELDQLLDGTFVKEPYIEMADILAQWRDAGYFNIDYSSATFDDLARRMAQNELAFLFNPNGGAWRSCSTRTAARRTCSPTTPTPSWASCRTPPPWAIRT